MKTNEKIEANKKKSFFEDNRKHTLEVTESVPGKNGY